MKNWRLQVERVSTSSSTFPLSRGRMKGGGQNWCCKDVFMINQSTCPLKFWVHLLPLLFSPFLFIFGILFGSYLIGCFGDCFGLIFWCHDPPENSSSHWFNQFSHEHQEIDFVWNRRKPYFGEPPFRSGTLWSLEFKLCRYPFLIKVCKILTHLDFDWVLYFFLG
jgi:hypothetical protein